MLLLIFTIAFLHVSWIIGTATPQFANMFSDQGKANVSSELPKDENDSFVTAPSNINMSYKSRVLDVITLPPPNFGKVIEPPSPSQRSGASSITVKDGEKGDVLPPNMTTENVNTATIYNVLEEVFNFSTIVVSDLKKFLLHSSLSNF